MSLEGDVFLLESGEAEGFVLIEVFFVADANVGVFDDFNHVGHCFSFGVVFAFGVDVNGVF